MIENKDGEAEHRDYFGQVVKEAIKSLRKGKSAYVFSIDHVNRIKELEEFKDIKVKLDEGIYYLSIPR